MSDIILLYIIGVFLAYFFVFSYCIRYYKYIKTRTLILFSIGSYLTIFLLLIYIAAKSVTKDEDDVY